MEVRFSYGCMSDTLEEQANAQGLTLRGEAGKLEKIRKAINVCMFHAATDAQVKAMTNKLNKQVVKSLKAKHDEISI